MTAAPKFEAPVAALRALAPGAVRVIESPQGRLLLLAAACGKGGVPGVMTALAEARRLSAREAMAPLGLDFGFRVEDAIAVDLVCRRDDDAARAWEWLDRTLPDEADRDTLHDEQRALRMILLERTGPPTARPVYDLDAAGRLRVEAFELHVAEDCNLRCANCCNLSPFVEEKRLTVDELRAQLSAMAKVIRADVFKIMGGEPLQHPDIAAMLRVARESGIGKVVRLFTNGLLLKRQTDDFWSALDQMTISSYSSAPVPQATLELTRAKAIEFGFVLNVKPVASFSQVLSPRYETSAKRVQEVYDTCWLRHRCLIVRAGRFYKCTRAAYAREFHSRVDRDPPPAGFNYVDDGMTLADATPEMLRDYMNAPEPLASCHYCQAGAGPLEAHHQLTKQQVAAGLLSRTLTRA